MDEIVLRGIGLSKTESKVYLALLRLGSASAGEISEITGIHRRNVYDALNMLNEKALAGFVEKDKKYYTATNPKKLYDLLKEKEELLESILPKLSEIFTHPKVKQRVYVYEGKEGLKTVMNDVIKEGKDWYILGSKGTGKMVLGPWVDYMEKRRVRAGIKLNAIFNDTPDGRKRVKELIKIGLTKAKLMPKAYLTPISTYIYGNKLALMLWSDISPISIIIESEEFSNAFRSHFNLTWDIATDL